ncbi:MAG: nitroreductase family protein [Deltaproteobacteria bacterium]|nr:nitroreductase family protein [Deltaproteobacteria bacterium]
MEFRDLETLIKTRRSIRKWKKDSVPEDLVLKAIEMATWAPNGGNHQNWKFVVVTDRNRMIKMADSVQSRIDMIASWPEAKQFGETVEYWRGSSSFFRHGPVCIAVLMAGYESLADQILQLRMKEDPSVHTIIEGRRLGNSGLQSVAAAISYLLLAIHAQGLGGIWMTGPLLAKAEIEEILNVPSGLNLVALVPVGFPDEKPTKTRKPLSEVVEFCRSG